MKQIKRVLITLLIIAAFMAPTLTPIASPTVTVQAATISISKKKVTLESGATKTLKVNGTSKKVTWSSNDKAVATVSSKGKIKAIDTGSATITATVGTTKLTCKVVVIDASSSATKK